MTPETPLDHAHAAQDGGDATRLRYMERVADAELFLLLAAEADGERVEPEVFEVEGDRFVLAFDREDRLATFAGRAVPYTALPGRALAAMLAGQALGVALNPDVAPSADLLGPEAIDWLHETLGEGTAEEIETRIAEIHPPAGLPEGLLTGLDAKLAAMPGAARLAYLAAATYGDGGGTGHVLAFVDAAPGAEPDLTRAVSEVLAFSGLEAAALDVAFLRAAAPLAARLARVGLRFDLPQRAEPAPPKAPGTDPDRPPRLR
ncbi:MAG: SseB family protein [Shimia sp.]